MIYFFQYIPPLYSSYAILFTTKYINLSYVSLCENNFKTFEKTIYPYLKPQKTISQNRPLFYFTQKQKTKNIHTFTHHTDYIHFTPSHIIPISTTPNTKTPTHTQNNQRKIPHSIYTHILSTLATYPHKLTIIRAPLTFAANILLSQTGFYSEIRKFINKHF